MKLDEVKQTLQDELTDDGLVLDDPALRALGLHELWSALSEDPLRVDDATLDVTGDRATLTGTATVLDAAAVDLTLTFRGGGDATEVELAADIGSWTPRGVDWAAFTGVTLTATVADGAAPTVGLTGTASMAGTAAAVRAGWADGALQLGLAVERVGLADLAGALRAAGVAVAADLPSLTLVGIELQVTPATGALSLRAAALGDAWTLPVGRTELAVGDVGLEVARSATTDEAAGSWTVRLAGTLRLGTTAVTVAYEGPGELALTATAPTLALGPLVQDLAGPERAMAMDVPVALLAVQLTDVTATLEPSARRATFRASSSLGDVVLAARSAGDGTGVVAVLRPAATWRFSSLAPELAGLDGLDLSGSSFVLASDDLSLDDDDVVVAALPDGGRVTQGLQLAASLTTAGTGLDETLGLEQLRIGARIGSDLADLALVCAIDVAITLAEDVVFGELVLELRPSPADLQLRVLGVVDAVIDGSPLRFTGGLAVRPRGAQLEATMEGTWADPLGAAGVALSDVAMEVGLTWPPLLPSFGLAGTLQLGGVVGSAAVQFDASDPTQVMLAVGFDRLHLMDVVGGLAGHEVVATIPPELRDGPLDLEVRDAALEVVPRDTMIGTLRFAQGTRLRGTISFWGAQGAVAIEVSRDAGIAASAALTPLSLADGLLVLAGADGTPGPRFALDLGPARAPRLELAGLVSLLGLTATTVVQVDGTGYRFLVDGRIFSRFACTIEGHARTAGLDAEVWLRATLRNDLFGYLREEATRAIAAAADAATADLTAAQRDLDVAAADVRRIDGEIARVRGVVQAERARDQQRYRDAQAALAAAEADVRRLDQQIAAARRTVQAERERDQRNLRAAEADVAAAQREVNSLQRQINDQKRWISTLNGQIAAKKRWYDRLSFWDKTWGWAAYSGYATAKGAEITTAYTKIGGLETAKGVATGALEAAKAVLRGLQAGASGVPVDADPRVAGLFAARETAVGGVTAARGVVGGLQHLARAVPVDADPRVAALFVARDTALGGLAAARASLDGAKAAVGGLADVGAFIADAGLGGLLDVRAASFEGWLSATSGGRVQLDVEVVFMGEPHRLQLAIDLTDPLTGARRLADQLLELVG